MAKVEKITIALTAEMAAVVKGVVAKGEYASTSEVIRDALRDWEQRRELRDAAMERLGKLIDEGIASGGEIPAEEVYEEVRHEIYKMMKKSA